MNGFPSPGKHMLWPLHLVTSDDWGLCLKTTVWLRQCPGFTLHFPPHFTFSLPTASASSALPFCQFLRGGKKKSANQHVVNQRLERTPANTHSDFSQFTPLPCWVTFTQPTRSLLWFFFFTPTALITVNNTKPYASFTSSCSCASAFFSPNQLRWRHIRRQSQGLSICMETH